MEWGGQQPYPRIPIDIQKWSPPPTRAGALCAYVADQDSESYPPLELAKDVQDLCNASEQLQESAQNARH